MWTPAQRSAQSCLKSAQPCWVQSLDSLTKQATREGWPRWPKGAPHWVTPEDVTMIKAPLETCGCHLTLTTALLLRARLGLQWEAC